MDIKIKKLRKDAVVPHYAKDGDAGMDLTAVDVEYDEKIDCYIYHTGIAVEVPKGHVGLLFARSSNRKTDGYLPNHVGVLDSGYRGEIIYSYKLRDRMQGSKMSKWQEYLPYKIGDRIGQIIILPYPNIKFIVSDKLSETERGNRGFGSTGD